MSIRVRYCDIEIKINQRQSIIYSSDNILIVRNARLFMQNFAFTFALFFHAINSDSLLQILSNSRALASSRLILQFQQSRPAFITTVAFTHSVLTCYLYIRISLNAFYSVVIFILHFEHTARGWLVSSPYIDYYY